MSMYTKVYFSCAHLWMQDIGEVQQDVRRARLAAHEVQACSHHMLLWSALGESSLERKFVVCLRLFHMLLIQSQPGGNIADHALAVGQCQRARISERKSIARAIARAMGDDGADNTTPTIAALLKLEIVADIMFFEYKSTTLADGLPGGRVLVGITNLTVLAGRHDGGWSETRAEGRSTNLSQPGSAHPGEDHTIARFLFPSNAHKFI